jgi:hypothetical protein
MVLDHDSHERRESAGQRTLWEINGTPASVGGNQVEAAPQKFLALGE